MQAIDVSALLEPVSAEAPAGEELGNELYLLNSAIQPKPDPSADPNDPDARDRMLPPDWASAKKEALELLARSKDLRIVTVLLQALPITDDMSGFADGLSLLRSLLENYWETLYPPLDDGDPIDRASALRPIADMTMDGNDLSDTTGTLAHSFRRLSLTRDAELKGAVCLRDIKHAQKRWRFGGKPGIELQAEQVEKVFSNTANRPQLQASGELLARIEADVKAMGQYLATVISDPQDLPTFDQLSAEISDVQRLLAPYLGVDEEASEAPGEAEAVDAPSVTSMNAPAAPAAPAEVASRDDVLKALDRICEYYDRHEPSSPVPLLLQRAKRLAAMNFLEILADLAPTGVDEAQQVTGKPQQDGSDSYYESE